MGLLFQPRPGAVIMCDFRGFEAPEMIKVRPVVVLARNRKARDLVTVIPLSTTEPNPVQPHHHRPSRNPLPRRADMACWAKCDMVATVALSRLDRYKASRREYLNLQLEDADFQAIRRATAAALELRGCDGGVLAWRQATTRYMCRVPFGDLQDRPRAAGRRTR